MIMVEGKAPVSLPINLGWSQESRPAALHWQTTRSLFLRGGSPQDVSGIVSMSINPPLNVDSLIDEEKMTVLAAKFWSQGIFTENLKNWNNMLAIVNWSNKKERSLSALLCLEAFYDAREHGSTDPYFKELVAVFVKRPSPLAEDHKSIIDPFSRRYYNGSNMPNINGVFADIHRFRRSNSKKNSIIEESPLDVEESAFFE